MSAFPHPIKTTELLNATPHQAKLFDLTYAQTFHAADQLSDAFAKRKITLDEARAVLANLTAATAAWQTFTDLLNGQPEPQRG